MEVMFRMEEVSRMARKLFQFKNTFLINQRGVKSKKLEREKKVLFGKLVETLPEKRKNQKKQLKKQEEIAENDTTEIIKTNRTYKKTEENFLLGHANQKFLNVISNTNEPPKPFVFKKENEKSKKFSYTPLDENTSNLENVDNKKSDTHISVSDNITTSTKNQDVSRKENYAEDKNAPEKSKTEIKKVSNVTSPSEIIVKNMLSFSIYDSTKSARIAHKKMTITDEIISLSAKADIANSHLPSVTRILSATMSEASRKALTLWKEDMIQKLGADGFEVYQQNLFKDGHDLHSSIENALLQKEYKVPESVQPAFESVQNVLKDISSVSALETHVVHPKLFYRGITDCVATYRGELCLIDWKKSDKRKDTISSVYDAPTQVASYIGALNADLNYPFEIKRGLVVVAYTSGEEATVHEIIKEDLQIYWKAWLRRLQKYFVDLKNVRKENSL